MYRSRRQKCPDCFRRFRNKKALRQHHACVHTQMATEAEHKYGGRGRPWHADFIKYVHFIANHPTYAGMPDAMEEGRVQWEAPSNRTSGRFKETHNKRRQWWREKAKSVGIEPDTANWISRTAKFIHPTKFKPCKICGKVAELRYVYPQERLFARLRKQRVVGSNYAFNKLESISALVKRLHRDFGDDILAALPEVLAAGDIEIPTTELHSIADWLQWIEKVYIPQEPSILSPGAMSNAPDRFDGFHSDNICCRHTADKGRHKDNLAGYVTDRRVFEYWAAGDWVAADRLMGKVRTILKYDPCRNSSHSGPCDADHIGPISLGFTHRPAFQLLCGSCNSGKNNRMTASDVAFLLAHERSGEVVISWHSRRLWDLRKQSVVDNETALRLSKLLRENRHTLMHFLERLFRAGHLAFLTTLLELGRADFEVDFENVHADNGLVKFDREIRTKRITKYANEQKVRRCRIAFGELQTYSAKENRNAFIIRVDSAENAFTEAAALLARESEPCRILNRAIESALADKKTAEQRLLALLPRIAAVPTAEAAPAQNRLQAVMDAVGEALSDMWQHERYVRT